MDACWELLLLLCLFSAAEFGESKTDEQLVKNLTDTFLHIIPSNDNNSTVFALEVEGNRITLNETDQHALNGYPELVELHLGGNLITTVPANYFSKLRRLRLLSLDRNGIRSLDPEAFTGLDVLEKLDLSNNKLDDLPGNMLSKVKHLKILYLQENPWNCSCPLLNTVRKVKEANITIGGSNITCASPAEQQGRNLLDVINLCSTSSTVTMITDNKSPTVTIQQPKDVNNEPTTISTSQNCTVSKDQKLVVGNTWKFTACVVALALTTCALILTAIKGPSWYKRFHNYRHRRLDGDDSEEWQETTTSEVGSQQTFTLEELSHRIQEQEMEDGYFEDPYIKRAENAEEDIPGVTGAF